MLIELGNPAPQHALPTGSADPDGPPDLRHVYVPLDGERVTYVRMPGEAYPLVYGADMNTIARHLARQPDVTNLPGLEALLAVVHPSGLWNQHTHGIGVLPTWVRCSGPAQDERYNDELARLISEFYGIPVAPEGDDDWDRMLEETHYTRNGPPGVGFDPLGGVTALKTNSGNDIQALQMANAGGVLGQTGTASATSATSLTGGTESPGGSHAASDAAGLIIVAWSSGAYGLVVSNTTGTSPVYTIDRWYTPGSPGGAAAATPSGTTGYTLLSASAAAYFMGLTANASAPGAGDVTLAAEITTASGGLIRKICPTAHTASANSYTLTPVFTANGSDSLPVTIAKIGVSQSMVSTVRNLFQTLLNVTATLSASGDQLTITETVTT